MKIWLGVLLLLALSAYGGDAASEVLRLAMTSEEKIRMKEDLGRENPKWKFVAGQVSSVKVVNSAVIGCCMGHLTCYSEVTPGT